MNPADPDNTALDALFLRVAKHPEVRMEFCAALLEAELLSLVPLVPRVPMGGGGGGESGGGSFMMWAQHGKRPGQNVSRTN